MIDILFLILSLIAFFGWIILIGFPGWAYGRKKIVGLIIPGIFAIAYLILFPALYIQAPGGFSSIKALLELFTYHPAIMLAAWLHYLAFDLLIGKMILDESKTLNIPHTLMILPLFLCFFFGPVGWLLYLIIKQVRYTYKVSPTTQKSDINF